jgi:hypothetical protein
MHVALATGALNKSTDFCNAALSAAAIEELLIIWLASGAEEWVNQICYLPL